MSVIESLTHYTAKPLLTVTLKEQVHFVSSKNLTLNLHYTEPSQTGHKKHEKHRIALGNFNAEMAKVQLISHY